MANDSLEREQLPDQPSANAAPQSAFCGSLRSKKFFMMDSVASDASHYLDASNHCWCKETQQVFGPDGDSVRPDACIAGRSCYGSAFDA